MNTLDIIIIIPFLWAAWKGFSKGFIIELCTLMALVLGIYGAIKFSDIIADYLIKNFNTDTEMMPLIAFAITFIGIVILVHLFGRLLEGVIKMAALGLVNKIAGALFSIAKYALIISTLIYLSQGFFENSDILPEDWKKESLLYEPLAELAPTIYPPLQESGFFKKLKEQARELKKDLFE